MSTPLSISRDDVKRLSVYKQGLHQRPESNTRDDLKRIIERIGLLQLDSISVVARSHYLVMHARAGLYNRAELDSLLDDGFLFESWAHAACQLPMAHYPYYHPFLLEQRKKEPNWLDRTLGDDAAEVINHVLDMVRENGAMSSKDFDSKREGPGGWWSWKPTKIALEYLFLRGELMTSYRKNFQRYYDLAERVLADHNHTLDKTLEDYHQWTIEQGLRRLGVGTIDHIADYYREHKRTATAIIQTLLDTGDVLPVEVAGWQDPAYIHRDDLPLLEQIQAGDHTPQLTAFLSPFDNLIWHRERDEMLWDFYYRIEVYTPKAKRVYGYYVLPILHKSELVGRVDPKVERKQKHLIFHALHLEDGTPITDELIQGLITAIEDFMAFHHCKTFQLTDCANKELQAKLSRHFG